MSPEAREKRNEYIRKWRANNKDKVQLYNKRYWERQKHKNDELQEWRCDSCGKLLGMVNAAGKIKIKCPRCKKSVCYEHKLEALEAL